MKLSRMVKIRETGVIGAEGQGFEVKWVIG